MKEQGKNTLSHIYVKIICNIFVIESSGQKCCFWKIFCFVFFLLEQPLKLCNHHIQAHDDYRPQLWAALVRECEVREKHMESIWSQINENAFDLYPVERR